MAKKAVLIGINYPGTKAELKGCVNDVWRMHKCLIERYGFSENDITVLIDTDSSYKEPTGKNIRSALSNLVGSAEEGDVLFVHYSGHGTRLPAETGEDDDTGYDECIVPSDMNLITGLRSHHGRRDDEENEDRDLPHGVKNRSLPLSTLIDILKQKTGKEDINVGQLRPTLFDVFGEDSSPKVKKFMNVIFSKLQHGGGEGEQGGILGMVGSLAQEFLKQKLDGNDEGYAKPAMETKHGIVVCVVFG
ncbi:hypothetical protein TSUD_364060 [Trifolium subterraneum]|uniref:Peptidase C14 caspase domain-containing protein n=1 Tax=Trifolium subterraneum TaxID=3900 RepID=A0A2Z6NGC6_TRISU|nr:hypothetical protein TSUD_364060 [Trifolium subterraneum]